MFKVHPFLAPVVAAALACVACGASFTAHDGNGAFAGSGNAGEASGGVSSSAGSTSPGDAGEVEAGGTGSAGQGSGEGGSLTGTGGSTTGSGGSATGSGGSTTGWGGRGNWGSGGRRGGADCTALEQEYGAAVDKARLCDKGSIDQCNVNSVAQPIGGCGCPVLINAKSEAAAEVKRVYQAYQDARCEYNGGPVCDVYCPTAVTASCAQQAQASASTCTAGIGIQN